MSSLPADPPDHAARLRALERADEVAAALEREPTFAARLKRLATELAPCRVEALDGEGDRIVVGTAPADGVAVELSAGGRAFGTVIVSGDMNRAVVARAAALLDAARLLESEQRARLRTRCSRASTSALSGAATPEEVGHGGRRARRAGAGRHRRRRSTHWRPADGRCTVIGSWGYDPERVDSYRAVAMTSNLPVTDVDPRSPIDLHRLRDRAAGRATRRSSIGSSARCARSRCSPARTCSGRSASAAPTRAGSIAAELRAARGARRARAARRSNGRGCTAASSSPTIACTGFRRRRRRWRGR